jgi:hypothetical protein
MAGYLSPANRWEVALSQIGKSGKDRKMARYIVHGIVKIDVQSEIEADSKAEAMLIASKMSGSDFDEEEERDQFSIESATALFGIVTAGVGALTYIAVNKNK